MATLAQTPRTGEATTVAAPLTVEQVETQLKQLAELKELDEAIKTKAKTLLEQAVRELKAAQNWSAKTDEYTRQIDAAPDAMQRLRRELSLIAASPPPEDLSSVALRQLEERQAAKSAELATTRARLVELENELTRRASRRLEIPKELLTAREQLAEIQRQLATPPAAGEAVELATARRTSFQARQAALNAQVIAAEKEQAASEATTDLIPLERDVAAARVANLGEELKRLATAIDRRRRTEVVEQVRQARVAAQNADPLVAELIEENLDLAQQRSKLRERFQATTEELATSSQTLAGLNEQLERTQKKVADIGLSHAIGVLLRKQRAALPDLDPVQDQIEARQEEIRTVQLRLFDLEEARSALSVLEPLVESRVAELAPRVAEERRQPLEWNVRDALETQKDYLSLLLADYNSYFEKLVDLDSTQRQLVSKVTSYAQFIDERVLWIRSAPPLTGQDFKLAWQGLAWLFNPAGLVESWRRLHARALSDPLPSILAIAFLAALLYLRRSLRRRLLEIARDAEPGTDAAFAPSVRALLLTVLVTLPVPGLLAYLGYRLTSYTQMTDQGKACGAGLLAAAMVLMLLELMRQTFAPQGLAVVHFGWSRSGVAWLRQQLRGLTLLILPLAFLTAAMHAQDNQRYQDSLGRLAFVAALFVLAYFLHRVLRSAQAPLFSIMDGAGLLLRMRWLWYAAGVLVPMALAALAVSGYYYTALRLVVRLQATLALLFALLLGGAMLLRWIVIVRRKLAIAEARRRRDQILSESTNPAAASSEIAAPIESSLDLTAINSQTRRLAISSTILVGVLGLWLIWVDVLPALSFFSRIELWNTTMTATTSVTDVDGATRTVTEDRHVPVTLANLLLAIAVATMTMVAARNIPGLLELAVLRRLPMDDSLRYTVTTVSRYGIVMVGIVIAFSMLGIAWGQVQWLLAIVGVGLGFGLQEIFANFVSGLIILMERPLRVGDVITIGDVTGRVTRIHMRATTVVDWDRKELIVPNKEFITGRLLNWTLSDNTNRVVINVGVAYSSDPRQAHEVLMEVVTSQPLVLTDPPPIITFEQFGDSTLNFVIRLYLPSLDVRLHTINELHNRIHHALGEAGIEIAFPQRDIYIRSFEQPLHVDRRRRPLAETNGAGQTHVKDATS